MSDDNHVDGEGNWPIISPLYILDEEIGKLLWNSRLGRIWSDAWSLFFHILFNSCPWWDECHVDGWKGFLV